MKRTRKPADTKPEHEEQRASLLPSEMAPEPGTDLLTAIVAFHNEPDRDDEDGKAKWTNGRVWMPSYLLDARATVCLLGCAENENKPIPAAWVSGYALKEGARRLRGLPGIRTIDEQRALLRYNGDVRRVLQLSWAFALTGLAGQRTGATVWLRAAQSTWSTVASLAAAIGVPSHTVAALAHLAIFVELPLANCVRAHMRDQLRAFKASIADYADEAIALAARSTPATTDLDLNFGRDILGGGEDAS